MHTNVDLKFDGAQEPAGAPNCLSLRLIPEPGHHIRFEDGTLWAVSRIEHTLKERELTPALVLKPAQE